jgi:ADP-ribose pyrophosphatase
VSDAEPPPPGRIASRRIHTGRVLNLDVDAVRFPDGSSGELEMIRHPGAAAVLPVLPPHDAADPSVLLIHQYRYAAEDRLWEAPAGRLEPGESPLTCARRELQEETGAVAERFEHLTTIFTTPGFTDERIHLYVAWVTGTAAHRRERDEFIEVAPFPISRVLEMIRDGRMVDGKSIVLALYFAGFRLRL